MTPRHARHLLFILMAYLTLTVGYGILTLDGGHTQTDALVTHRHVLERLAGGHVFFKNFLRIGNLHKHIVSLFVLPYFLTDYFPFVLIKSIPINKKLLILWTSRTVSLLSGLGSILLVYQLGSRMYRTRYAGITGAVLLTLSKDFLNQSVLATEDALSYFMLLLSLYCSLVYSEKLNTKYFLFGWISGGLALATKPTAGICIIPLLVIELKRYRNNEFSLRELAARYLRGFLIAAGTFLVLTPSLFVYPGNFIQDALYQSHTRYSPNIVPTKITYFLHFMLLVRATGYPVLYCLMAGFVTAIYRSLKGRPRNFEVELVTVILVYFLFVGSWNTTGAHYMILLVPLLSIVGGHWLYSVLRKMPGAITYPTLALLVGYSLVFTWLSFLQISHNSLDAARNWLNQYTPPSAIVDTWGIGQYYPAIPDRTRVKNIYFETSDHPNWQKAKKRLRARRPDLLLLSESFYRRYLARDATEVSTTILKLLRNRHDHYGVYKSFGPDPRSSSSYAATVLNSFKSRPLFPVNRNLTVLVKRTDQSIVHR